VYDLQIQNDLLRYDTDGVLYLKSDLLFMEGSTWLVASPVPAPDLVQPQLATVLQAFFHQYPSAGVDMRVLTAKTYTSAGRSTREDSKIFDFIPADGIQSTSMSGGGPYRGGQRRIEMGVHSLFGADRTDLTALWEAGQAVAHFDEEGNVPFQERKAAGYTFRFSVPGPNGVSYQRVVRVAGGPWRALHAMGMRAAIANHGNPELPGVPLVGFAHPSNPSQLFGVMSQIAEGPVLDSDDGRDLAYHPLACSWATDADLYAFLRGARLDTSTAPVLGLADVLASQQGSYGYEVRAAVDALRWRRCPEEDIDRWLRSALPEAYAEMATGIAAQIIRRLESLEGGRHSDGTIERWDAQSIEENLRRLSTWQSWFPTPESKAVFDAVIPGARDLVENLRPFYKEG
jgi:hypothetical protein